MGDRELVELIVQAQKGRSEAFAELVRRFQGEVFRHAYTLLEDRMEAEDAAQDAFVKVFRSLDSLESPYAFAAWLTRIVANGCYDRLARRRKEQAAAREAAPAESGQDELERLTAGWAVRESMRQLSPEHREILLLREVEGYSYDELAERLGLPLGTIKSRIHAARRLLRAELEMAERET